MARDRKPSIKLPERLLPGVYANQMVVRHTREEFLIDFINRFPPEGVVAARVIVSPGHLKRMIQALQENFGRYELGHGPIREAASAYAASQGMRGGPGGAAGDAAGAPAGKASAAAKGGGESHAATRISEAVLAGVYANQMVVSHSREEFLLDFVNIFPPEGVLTARVFVSPPQLERMIRALAGNFGRYEATHGTIVAATAPQPDSYLN